MAQTYTKEKIDELIAQASSNIDTALQNASDALNEAQSAASDVSDLSATVSDLSNDVNGLVSLTKPLEYNLTQQEALGVLSSTYSNPVEIGIHQSLAGYDRVILVADDFTIEFRYVGIYAHLILFEARVNACVLYDPSVSPERISDAEFVLYSSGNRVFVAFAPTITRYYGITISGISINQSAYTLHAIVDAYGVDEALQTAGTNMAGLQSNFQQLAQGNPTLFAQLLFQLCNNGFEMGRPCYLRAGSVSTMLCTALNDVNMTIEFGSQNTHVSLSLVTSDIPTEFASASLLYSTQWLSAFGVLYD